MATVTHNDRIWSTWTSSSTSATVSSSTYYVDSNNSIWGEWCDVSEGTVTTTDTSNSKVWYEWNRDFEAGGTVVKMTVDDGTVWEHWISDQFIIDHGEEAVHDTVRDMSQKVFAPSIQVIPTVEEKRAKKMQRRIRHEWSKVLYDEEMEEKAEAELVAQELLLDLIGEDELKRYQETGRLFVKGRKFDYVLRNGGGVHRIHKDKVVDFVKKKKASGKTICVHPKRSSIYPPTDNVITLKMWIENNEKEFLKIGNLSTCITSVENFDKVVGL